MLKRILGIFLAVFTSIAFAATDANQASAEELNKIKGIGPATAERIIEAREKSNFKDWDDFIKRVDGIGAKKAEAFSQSGLTIQGKPYTIAPSSTPAASQPAAPQK